MQKPHFIESPHTMPPRTRILLPFCLFFVAGPLAAERLPNIVILFMDDMGYADIGPFGAEGYETPNLDQMAREGRRFTDFYVTQAVCSSSRAGLLTGCYNQRVGINGALGPGAGHGLAEEEETLAEICKQKGYATACFGKWHLGHRKPFLPLQHGFDEYFGLPYSNDMWPLHPDYAKLPADAVRRKSGYPDLPLIEGNEVIDPKVTGEDQAMLTTWYTEHAVDFIERNKDRPFFLYVPQTMVHVPLFVSDKFKGKSAQGLFGDVMMEIDWSVGQILDTIRNCGLEKETLVIFTSDNGPWLSYGNHAGSAKPLREGKATMFDGGCRVPTVMWWPGTIPADTSCDKPAMTIDLLPTVAHLIGAKLPQRKIDGRDIGPLLTSKPDDDFAEQTYALYFLGELQAVRRGRWKLHFPHRYRTLAGRAPGQDGRPVKYQFGDVGLELFDLKNDPGETKNVAAAHPEVVARLQADGQTFREDLGDTLIETKGKGLRPAGQL